MKTTLIILSLALLVSCGKETVHKDFLVENPYDNSANEAKFTQLEQSIAANISAITALSESLTAQQNSLTALQASLEQADADTAAYIQTLIDTGTAAYNDLQRAINVIQSQLSEQQAQIAELQKNKCKKERKCGF